MEVKAVHVVGGNLVVLHNRSVAHDGVTCALEHSRGRLGGGQVLMSMDQTLDHPGGLDIDEHSLVIGGERRGEDAYNLHLEGIDPRQVEDALR